MQPVDRIHAEHHQLGIGDPDDVDDAEDQVQAKGQQRQHAAEQDAIYDGFEQEDVEEIHRQSPRKAWRTKSLAFSSAALPESRISPTSST
jgi:hypothetical protein